MKNWRFKIKKVLISKIAIKLLMGIMGSKSILLGLDIVMKSFNLA